MLDPTPAKGSVLRCMNENDHVPGNEGKEMRRLTRFGLYLIFAVMVSLGQHAVAWQDEDPGWTPELALQVKRISNVRVSPDGTRVLYEVSVPRMEEETSEWVAHIHVADADGRNTYQLTRGEKSCSGGRWSSDGKWIAFTSSRGSEKSNIFRINVRGGEAEQLTDVKGGISGFQWSPDAAHIAFVMTDPPTEDEETEEKEKRDARTVDEDLKMARLHIMPVEQNEEGERPTRLLTEGNFHVSGGFSGATFDFAPDGTAIVFTHTPTPKRDDWPKADISIVEVSSASVRPLVSTGAAEASAVFSPDGQSIAYSATDDPPTWARTGRVHVIAREGGEPRPLATTFDERPRILGWNADGTNVLVWETHETRYRIYALSISGGDVQTINTGDRFITGATLDRTGTHLGFTSEAPARPAEAFVSNVNDFSPVQVSDVQDLPDLALGRTEAITWKSSDGLEIEGLLTYPTGYEPGNRVPLLVIVHGGPTGVFQQRFIANRSAYPIAAFASRGYAVLRCNPRGSGGYGKAFRYANYDDWGFGDYQDIMAGVDHVIDMGVADADRMGIMGWSYGGYMTSWVITQTDRFKVASVGAGVTNLMSFNGTADIPGFVPDYFHGESWENLDAYIKHSAMFNVKGVTTPTLIQHGEKDARVPISQGYELYNALKRQNVQTKMIVYPRQPHGIREPKLALQAMRHNLEWFDTYLRADESESD